VTGNKVTIPDVVQVKNNGEEKENVNPDNSVNHDNTLDNIVDNQSDKKVSVEENVMTNTLVNPDGVRFMVQFMALPEKISLTDKRFSGIPNVNRYHEGNLWKYTAGNEPNLSAAKEVLKIVKTKYPDAFIIAFKGEEKIPVSEAVKLVK
jgi:N-acetylmuramoyl-L-alanine amidase